VLLSVPNWTAVECRERYVGGQRTLTPRCPLTVDLLTIAGIAMLALWAAGTFAFDAPGIVHGLLTLGVFLIVLAAVRRSAKARGAK
jgi:hypothetical protein